MLDDLGLVHMNGRIYDSPLMPFWRLVLCCNHEPEALSVIPPLTGDIRDKLLLLRTYRRPMPMPTQTRDQQVAFWAELVDQIPSYLHWLSHGETPERLRGRFGCVAWCHPDLEAELGQGGEDRWIDELIERNVVADGPGWQGSATELLEALCATIDLPEIRRKLPGVRSLGVALGR